MSQPRASDMLPRDLWVDHPQGRIFAREWSPPGVGAHRPPSPIVLFHDSLGCVELWRDFPAQLSAASGRRVIAYDRLGFGRSDAREVLPELDFIAEEARVYFPALREQLGLERFVVFGHSVGGGMAVNCAAAFAGACDALITESAQVFPEDLTLSSIAEAKGQFVDESQLQRLARYHGDKARWVLDAWTESWLHPGFAAWSLKSVLPQVRCPVLAIHGMHDEYGTRVHPEMIGELSAGPAQVAILPDTFHVPHRERPEAVIELVCGFLDPVRQGGPVCAP
ncbi:MAG: alpha/beta hydrolase [Thauera sp.]|nr:alpha/beta hydrolase [Thauera sp.]